MPAYGYFPSYLTSFKRLENHNVLMEEAGPVFCFPVVLVHKIDSNILRLDVYLSAKPKGKGQTNNQAVKNSLLSILYCF